MVENFCPKHQLFHKIGKSHAPSPITKDTKVTDELAQQERDRPDPQYQVVKGGSCMHARVCPSQNVRA